MDNKFRKGDAVTLIAERDAQRLDQALPIPPRTFIVDTWFHGTMGAHDYRYHVREQGSGAVYSFAEDEIEAAGCSTASV